MNTRQEAGRTANAKRNISFGMLQIASSMFFPFIVRTILIYKFGVEYVGINSFFASILGVLSIAELGFGTAIVYSLYRPVAMGDRDEICAYLLFYRRIYRIIGTVIATLGLLFIPILPILIHGNAFPEGLNLFVCYFIFLGNSVLSYLLFGYLTCLPTAFQRRDLLSRVDISTSIIKCALQCVVLLGIGNFYLFLFSLPVMTIIRNLMIAHVARKRYPEYVCCGALGIAERADLRKKVQGLFINKLFTTTRNGIDTVCISAFIGLTAAGIYSNYFYILAALVMVSSMVCRSMIPGVGNSIVTESREKNYKDLRKFDYIYTAIAGWAATCLLCLYQPFMMLWVGEDLMLGLPEVIGLSLYFYILKIGDIRWAYHEGAGLWWECRYVAITEAVVNVILNIVLCKFLGIMGIILATLLSLLLINFICCPMVLFRVYFKNGKLKEYFIDHLCYFATTLPAAGLSFWFCLILPWNSIVGLILCLMICSVVYIGLFFVIWHRTKRYRDAVDWMRWFFNV